jgi:AcrR family transcriptional regulator
MVQYNTKKGVKMTKTQSMAKARAIRTQRVKDRIQSAINVLTLYGDVKITIRAIAEEAGVSKTTVQKYLSTHK